MKHKLRWFDYLTINVLYFGGSTATGLITPVLLPYLVAAFVPPDRKNTYLAIIRVSSLALAMMVQPMAGLLSDRSTHPWGRRRPFIAAGSCLALVFLVVIGASPQFIETPLNQVISPIFRVPTAYLVLLVGIVLWQGVANVAQAAQQGFIPDLVPELQRGTASGVKALMELSAVVPVTLIAPLVDQGRIWTTIALICGAVVIPFLITAFGIREERLSAEPAGRVRGHLVRYVGLTGVFLGVTLLASGGLRVLGRALVSGHRDTGMGVAWGRLTAVGLAGLGAMIVAVVFGVYGGAMVGLGRATRSEATHRTSFTWWVIYRLAFLVAAGSIQQFTLYYMSDVHGVPDPAATTARLAATMGGFLLVSALASGVLSDRIGRIPLLALASGLSAAAAVVLILAQSLALVFATGCVFGLAVGTFMSAHWALGTDLAPRGEGGRYMGIANLAGAGAGIVGTGIGGPLADLVNTLQPGLGYLVIFAIDAGLFCVSILALARINAPALADALPGGSRPSHGLSPRP